MSTVDLPEGVAARFAREAARRGISFDELLVDLAEQLPEPTAGPENAPRRRPGFVSLGSSTSGRHARDADELLAEGFGRS